MQLKSTADQSIHDQKHLAVRKPGLHFTAPYGWINDPNGLAQFAGAYHLFYQHNPFGVQWDLMHWGHATSKDLIHWEDQPVALYPDQSYDAQGCYSGSGLVVDGRLWFMYTGHLDSDFGCHVPDKTVRENQNLAWTDNGVDFVKFEANPVLAEKDLPAGSLPQDFRDPKLFQKNGKFYCVTVGRDEVAGGQVLLYGSTDLKHWSYEQTMSQSNGRFGSMWECPDLFELEGDAVLLLSLMHEQATDRAFNSNLYLTGTLDIEQNRFTEKHAAVLDYGFSFYAPQTFMDDQNRRIMIGWLNECGGETYPAELGWAGMMSIPREVTLIDGQVAQLPVAEICQRRGRLIEYQDVVFDGCLTLDDLGGKRLDLELALDLSRASNCSIEVFRNEAYRTVISYDKDQREILIDRSLSGPAVRPEKVATEPWKYVCKAPLTLPRSGILDLRIILDDYSVEVFADQGLVAMTATLVPQEGAVGLALNSQGLVTLVSLKQYDLIV